MSELKRLLDGEGEDLEQALLRAARTERPRGAGLHGAALALGLSTATAQSLAASLPAAASVTAPAVVAASSASGVGVAAAGGASLAVLGKGLVGGTLVSFLALAAVDHTIGSSETAGPAPAALVAASSLEPAPRSPTEAPLVVKVDTQAVTSAPVVAPRPVMRAAPKSAPVTAPTALELAMPARAEFASPSAPPPAAAPSSSASLSAEIRLLDRARAALGARDLEAARRALDLYAASQPSAVLAPEAVQLRVRLLLASGQRRQAVELARAAINRHPESTHAESLRRLVEEP